MSRETIRARLAEAGTKEYIEGEGAWTFIKHSRDDVRALLRVADEVDGLMQTLSVIRVLDVFPGLLGRLHVIAEAMAALDALP